MLSKSFDHAAIEPRLYAGWEADGAFHADPASPAQPFTIMIPPPNVTGSLHMGHALTMTLQDALTRWRRMQGRDALWQPGTDHAGIATQMVVERLLPEEGNQTRQQMGRDAFIDRVWRWKAESGGAITTQLRRLGASLDWPRERFTMDEGLSRAVREVFVTLYREGLIYRDRRLVNWDPKFQSAISDLEVESREVRGSLWHLRYPIEGEAGRFIVVATTRPETMLGDVAVAVHPEDARYRDLIGRHAVLPLVGRRIPIVADAYSDPEKGTGAVKITPAHDFNDFAVGQRHSLPMPSVLDREGRVTLSEIGGDDPFLRSLDGQDRFAARKAIVAELERLGLLEAVEPHTHQVPHGDRSGVPIEPLLTTQWYCNAAELAKPAIAAVEGGRTRFVPAQWENTFFAWMRDIQPWCISRQLWWGHRIPAWFGPDGHVFVARDEAEAKAAAAGALWARRGAEPGRGRARHLVQLGAVAVLDPRLAGPHAGTRPLLPRRRARHRFRHHLLLGRPNDDDGAALHGRRAVPRHLHPRPRPRRARPEDVEIQGQRDRSARADRRVRHGRAALHRLRADRAGPRHQARPRHRRDLPQLRHQALERGPVLRDERRRPRSRLRPSRRAVAALPLDAGRR